MNPGMRAAAALLGLALAGCGSSATKTVTVTTPNPASTPGATTATTAAAPAITQTSVTSTAQPPTATVHLSAFRTPSGNIGCIIISGGARCDISKRNWSPPPRPASCPPVVDFGQGVALNPTGAGRFVCAGDTTRDPQATPLAYGEDAQVGQVRCASRTDGITCTNASTGHGFFIAVQGYRVF